MPPSLKGSSVLKLLQFGDHLSQFSVSPRSQLNGRLDGTHPNNPQLQKKSNNIAYWQAFVERFFSPIGVLRQQFWSSADRSTKQWEIATPALARYYWTHFNSGVQHIQMILETAKEKDLPTGGHFVESKSCFIYWYTNGHQVSRSRWLFGDNFLTRYQLVIHGHLRAQFDQTGRIDLLDLVTNEHSEYVPRQGLLQAAAESPDNKQSPNASKAAGKRGSQQRQKQQTQPIQDQNPLVAPVPGSMVNDSGTTKPVWQFLEVSALRSKSGLSHQAPP